MMANDEQKVEDKSSATQGVDIQEIKNHIKNTNTKSPRLTKKFKSESVRNPGELNYNDYLRFENEKQQKKNSEEQRQDAKSYPNNFTDSESSKEKSPSTIYYGIKSYLNQFYGPPDKNVHTSKDYLKGDDFRFLAEPRRKKNCCIRLGLWIGINFLFLGLVAMLVGYLTPPRPTIIGEFAGYTVLDKWAVNFNTHLVVCQLIGMITFAGGSVVVICSLLLANCQSRSPSAASTYYVMSLPQPLSQTEDTCPTWGIHCIPLSGTIKSVQPQFIRSQY